MRWAWLALVLLSCEKPKPAPEKLLTPSQKRSETIGFLVDDKPVCIHEMYSEKALARITIDGPVVHCHWLLLGYPAPGQPMSPWTDPKSPKEWRADNGMGGRIWLNGEWRMVE